MGDVLWTPHYQPGIAGGFARPYVSGVAVRWLPSLIVIAGANPIVLREVTYGGYTKWLKFWDWAWEFSHKSYNLLTPLEYYYVSPPGSSAHISNGDVNVRMQWFPDRLGYYWVTEDTGHPADAPWYFFDCPSS